MNGHALPYDDNGHGSHVSGIIAGNGYDSNGEKTGIAPDANIIALKVLNAQGTGTISNIIAALNWVALNATTYNIKVVNMSVGAGVYESYWTDPLTLATKKVTDKGITVVAAAGNMGKNAQGQLQYGAITAPGNAPWVLTVGASSTNGTLTRSDDTMASLQLVRADLHRLRRQAGPGRARHWHRVAGGSGQHVLRRKGAIPARREAEPRLETVSGAERDEHVGAGGGGDGGPDASGQPEPDAEPGQGASSVHGAGVSGIQPAPSGRRLPQLARRGSPGEVLRYAPKAGDVMPVQSVWSRQIIWGNHRLTTA